MDFITDIVREKGITDIIMDYKEQLERKDFLEDLILNNASFNDLLSNFNDINGWIIDYTNHLDNIDNIYHLSIQDEEYLEREIFGFGEYTSHLHLIDLRNILEGILQTYQYDLDDLFLFRDLNNVIIHKDIQSSIFYQNSYILIITYKHNDYTFDLLNLGY